MKFSPPRIDGRCQHFVVVCNYTFSDIFRTSEGGDKREAVKRKFDVLEQHLNATGNGLKKKSALFNG